MKARRRRGGRSFLAALFLLSIFSVIFLSVPAPAHAQVRAEPSARSFAKASKEFVFRSPSDIQGWRFDHVSEARIGKDGLLLRANNYLRMAPPPGLDLRAARLAMEIDLRSEKSLLTNIRARASNGWQVMKTVKTKVLDGADGRTRLRVYLGKTGEGKVRIQDFVLEFYSTESIGVRIGRIRVYEPTMAGVGALLWHEFWRPDFVTGATVGFVTTPEAGGVGLPLMLYLLAALVFVAALVFLRFRGLGLCGQGAARLLVLIILGAGLLFAVRMDYNWLVTWRDDLKTLSPVGADERLRIVNNRNLDSFLDFIAFLKKTVPPGRSVRPATLGHDSPLAAMARYYLLPIESSAGAPLIWSYGEVLSLDPATGALRDSKGRLVARRARPFASFADNAVIYEVF